MRKQGLTPSRAGYPGVGKWPAWILAAWMVFFLAALPCSGLARESKGVLTGRVILPDGSPLSGAFIYLFAAASRVTPNGDFRLTPEQIAGQLDRKGHFDVEVPVGEYYLSIIQRSSGKIWGTIRPGDRWYIHRDEKQVRSTITIRAGTTLDLATLVGAVVTEDTKQNRLGVQELAVIYGTLYDAQQRPVPGATVLVYAQPNRIGQPLFASEPSKADGSYSLKFFQTGTFYLVARAGVAANETPFLQATGTVLMGKFGGPARHAPLTITSGQVLTGMDITLHALANDPAP